MDQARNALYFPCLMVSTSSPFLDLQTSTQLVLRVEEVAAIFVVVLAVVCEKVQRRSEQRVAVSRCCRIRDYWER